MKPSFSISPLALVTILLLLPASCREPDAGPPKALISSMSLKRGSVISCGPAAAEFGSLAFGTSCGQKEAFNLAVKLLHSFEYDEAEKVFAAIIDKEPKCAMAYWGVAMSNFHPLWTPPTEAELRKGAKAIEIARAIRQKSQREAEYIDAIAAFYTGWQQADHYTRCLRFEKAMEKLQAAYPADKETAVFYALALTAAAAPADKSFAKQKKAGALLKALYAEQPNHPGIIHYLIHAYDCPGLAQQALPAARKYASVAPSSAHALHMPSHIFTRLGLWNECISSNLASVSSAQCYAQEAGIKGHWDEELHGLDYLVYAYLQKGDNELARKQWEYLKTIREVYPVNFKVAYAFAAIPARYLLENKLWQEAARLQPHTESFPWDRFPWEKAILHFTRQLGFVHTGDLASAIKERQQLERLHKALAEQGNAYKANQVLVQVKTAEAWLKLGEGKQAEALALMQLAADLEDKTEKHPVTPGEVLPARELLGDMLLQIGQPGKALEAYEANLQKHPNRFNGLYGAGRAAERSGNLEKAALYYRRLLSSVGNVHTNRPELSTVKTFFRQHPQPVVRQEYPPR